MKINVWYDYHCQIIQIKFHEFQYQYLSNLRHLLKIGVNLKKSWLFYNLVYYVTELYSNYDKNKFIK